MFLGYTRWAVASVSGARRVPAVAPADRTGQAVVPVGGNERPPVPRCTFFSEPDGARGTGSESYCGSSAVRFRWVRLCVSTGNDRSLR